MKMGRKLKLYGTAAVACAACLALAAPAKAEGEKCTLELKWGSEEIITDITENGKPSIDLYKVADAKEDTMFVTYSYDVKSPFDFGEEYGDLSTYDALAQLTNEDYVAMGQIAAKTVQDNDGLEFVTSENGKFGETPETKLEPGLYLAIAHDDKEEYWSTDEEGKIVSTITTERYEYSYYPQLLFLPSTVEDMTGVIDGQVVEISTAGGDWKFDLKATLKPKQDVRYGDLVVWKTFESWEDSSPVMCVFKVNAYLDGEWVYRNTISIWMTGADDKSYEIKGKIPVGATAIVEEVYDGAGYKLNTARSEKIQNTEIAAPEKEAASVHFYNYYDKKVRKGYGIENRFVFGVDDKGNIVIDPDQWTADSPTEIAVPAE